MDPTAHQTMELNGGADLQGFRQALRVLTWSSVPPEQVTWTLRDRIDRFGEQPPAPYGVAGKPIILPRMVGDTIRHAICHDDPQRYALLYDLVWRMKKPKDPEPYLPADANDPLVQRLAAMVRDVKRETARMQSTLRFQEVHDSATGVRFIAWFEPDHYIVEAAAPFFVDRFPSLDWTILTPRGGLWWDRKELAIAPPAIRSAALDETASALVWRAYHESTFNPPRTDMQSIRQYTAKKQWRCLLGAQSAVRAGPDYPAPIDT